MEIVLAHKIRLYPNKSQEVYFKQACGVARKAYNWALEYWQSQYASGNKPSGFGVKQAFNSIKFTEFPWMKDVTKCAPEQAILDLQRAFVNFFQKRAKYPKFRKKFKKDGFYLANDKFKVDGVKVRIPKLGWVRMAEQLRFSGKILSGRVKRVADKWFISIQVRLTIPDPVNDSQVTVGVDLGLNTFAHLSDDTTFTAPKPLKRYLKKLKRLQRSMSRKQEGSNNRHKAAVKIARLYYKISCIRQDFLHKLTSTLTARYSLITIEDLNVNGMLRNKRLSRAISDISMSEFRRQLRYKCVRNGSELIVADRWFPSSKTCSNCGFKAESMPLNIRQFNCPECGFTCDRDLNAAINLNTVGLTEINACGQANLYPAA